MVKRYNELFFFFDEYKNDQTIMYFNKNYKNIDYFNILNELQIIIEDLIKYI